MYPAFLKDLEVFFYVSELRISRSSNLGSFVFMLRILSIELRETIYVNYAITSCKKLNIVMFVKI